MRDHAGDMYLLAKRNASELGTMHVLVIAGLFPPDMGGGSTRAFNVVKGLISLGHKVTVVAAFPHYPKGNILGRYGWKPLSVEYEGG